MASDTKIPLAQRIARAVPQRTYLPPAAGLCAIDLFQTVGKLTDMEEHYQTIYEQNYRRYEPTDATLRVFQLVDLLDHLEDAGQRKYLLYDLLVEPFLSLQLTTTERNEIL